MKSPRRRSLLLFSTSLSSCLFKCASASPSSSRSDSASSSISSRLTSSSSSTHSSSTWLPATRRGPGDRIFVDRTSNKRGLLGRGLSRRGGSSSIGGIGDLTKIMPDNLSNHDKNNNLNMTTSSASMVSAASPSSILSSLFSSSHPLLTSTCSVRGERPYMEDEYFISEEGRFAAVFDGHGGGAVSRYLRQNLYANVQAALPSSVSYVLALEEMNNHSQNKLDGHADENDNDNDNDNTHQMTATTDGINSTTSSTKNNNDNKNHIQQKIIEKALRTAISKVDHEVQGISHWSFQGSTALAILLYNNLQQNERYIASANVGDSRAVLSRNRTAVDLTKDHKPNDDDERRRIEALGGTVDWCGEIDKDGKPVETMGVYRINGNLALSRAIGDRSERPWVTSEADVCHHLIDEEEDEFVLLASDGLFDVFSSQAVVDFIHGILDKTPVEEKRGVRKSIAKAVVEEALKRGTFDNITVLVLWINERD